jgi:hypothetical protein
LEEAGILGQIWWRKVEGKANKHEGTFGFFQNAAEDKQLVPERGL